MHQVGLPPEFSQVLQWGSRQWRFTTLLRRRVSMIMLSLSYLHANSLRALKL